MTKLIVRWIKTVKKNVWTYVRCIICYLVRIYVRIRYHIIYGARALRIKNERTYRRIANTTVQKSSTGMLVETYIGEQYIVMTLILLLSKKK